MRSPKPARLAKVTHYAALPWQDVGAFMVELRKREGIGARALEFSILTAARSGEVRGATWEEIDLQEKLWTIPGERMKAGKAHRVPLSEPALRVLKALPQLQGCPYVFPSPTGKMLSDMSHQRRDPPHGGRRRATRVSFNLQGLVPQLHVIPGRGLGTGTRAREHRRHPCGIRTG